MEKTPEHAWIFDIDGVITDPKEERITQPEIVKELVDKLQKNEPVALITGRALPWVDNRVIHELEKYLTENGLDSSPLDKLYVSGEFGGSTMTFQDGKPEHYLDATISIPQGVIDTARKITDHYAQWVFTDTEKQTHYTAELQHGQTVASFHAGIQQEIANAYRRTLTEHGIFPNEIEVEEDSIAINIRSTRANKIYATQQFLSWLKKKDITPRKYVAFGDSPSDMEMGVALQQADVPFTFAYTGIRASLASTPLFPVLYAEVDPDPNHTDEATIALLKALQQEERVEE